MKRISDLIGVKKETNERLKRLRDYAVTAIITLLLCIDWDATIDHFTK